MNYPLSENTNASSTETSWWRIVSAYQQPRVWKSLWQIVNTVLPYLALWYVAYLSLQVSYLLTLALSIPAAGFLVRIFIITHDCGHGAFFPSRKANDFFGRLLSPFLFTPYYAWRHEHGQHHARAGNLDRRGIGDFWTMTVKEYLKAPRSLRFWYRLYRNPVTVALFGAIGMFVIYFRFSRKGATPAERRSVFAMNVTFALIVIATYFTIGLTAFVLVQLPIIMLAGTAGIWMFYVQHQFEGVYWERNEEWDYVQEAIQGSSFYKLPKVLQWFSGNIGFHHVHHLNPKIPNYLLEKCHRECEMFRKIKPITLFASIKTIKFRLWDEENHQLVGFKILKKYADRSKAA